MTSLKQKLSLEAKQLNQERNADYDKHSIRRNERRVSLKESQKDLERTQTSLLARAFDTGLLCPSLSSTTCQTSELPAAHCPLRLSAYATQTGYVAPIDTECRDIVPPRAPQAFDIVGQYLLDRNAVAAIHQVDRMLDSTQGIHGLGDFGYPVSESLVEAASQKSGFVKASSSQFRADHCSVCDKVKELDVNADELVDSAVYCQKQYGRYCHKDIVDHQKFTNALGMVQSLVRALASKRTVKAGKSWYLSPDTPWPLLLICSDDIDNTIHARLACRVSFNPMELDFAHCSVPETGKEQIYKLVLDVVQGTPNLFNPRIDSMRELAVFYSQLSGNWMCKIYWDYEVCNGYIKVNQMTHATTTAEDIGESSFSGCIQRTAKADDCMEDGERQVLSSAMRLLGKIKSSDKPKADRSKQQKRAHSAPAIGKSKQNKRSRRFLTYLGRYIMNKQAIYWWF